jgi:hypothetical protein
VCVWGRQQRQNQMQRHVSNIPHAFSTCHNTDFFFKIVKFSALLLVRAVVMLFDLCLTLSLTRVLCLLDLDLGCCVPCAGARRTARCLSRATWSTSPASVARSLCVSSAHRADPSLAQARSAATALVSGHLYYKKDIFIFQSSEYIRWNFIFQLCLNTNNDSMI